MTVRHSTGAYGTLFVILAASLGVVSEGGVVHVDSHAAGANSGTSWEDAFVDLQAAFGAAEYGDRYPRGRGHVHACGSRLASFNLKNGVAIRGGYAGSGRADPDARDYDQWETVLSGDLNGDDGDDFAGYEENSYHVLIAAPGVRRDTILEGLTVTAGHADGEQYRDQYGAGIRNDSADPTLVACQFIAHWAHDSGGAMRTVNPTR